MNKFKNELLVTGCLFCFLTVTCYAADEKTLFDESFKSNGRQPLRLLVDEYHQIPRPETFSQGFSLNPDEDNLTYHYGTNNIALTNGLFVLSQLIAPDYTTKISTEPIGPDIAQHTDAYMIICPPTAKAGNPHPITSTDADHLEAFVAKGGILILFHNSTYDPDKDSFDFKGMNLIARRFGLEFTVTDTQTLLIPIARDHPVLFGTRKIIYGNGCTIKINSHPDAKPTVLLESNNPDVPGPVAVRVRYKKGTVLLFGDAGSFGNAHLLRHNEGHPDTVARLFHCLLPDGPLVDYGWKEGLKLKVKLRYESATSLPPEEHRLFDLPLDPAAKISLTGVREIDLQSSKTEKGELNSQTQAALKANKHRFAKARSTRHLEAQLQIGQKDGRAFLARWVGPESDQIKFRLTPLGEVMDTSPNSGTLDPWRWALVNEMIVGPIDPQALPGCTWESPVMTALPNAQLYPALRTIQATGHFQLEGRQLCRGKNCFVIKKTVLLPFDNLRPQDFVNTEFADYFDERQIRLRDGGQLCVTRTWIDEKTRLPVKTEVKASATLWWTDRSSEDWYLSHHDWRVFENRTEIRFVNMISRLLVAEFDVISTIAQ